MIQVQTVKQNGRYKSFTIEGHAGYADPGEDIVCAAVSALVINAINSIEKFTEDAYTCDCQDGMIKSWEFTSEVSEQTTLLMDSLMLGLADVQKSYGEKYLKVNS
ncbi:MAG: ribosomal-processing cysteine protease Prp [Lachnospiraceae bacterium]|nr:ribosomal-processing cysteine protease Prp [Lachnospiraceae bacterium]